METYGRQEIIDDYLSVELKLSGILETVDKLAEASQAALIQQRIAETSGLKQDVADAKEAAKVLAHGLHVGISVLETALPYEGQSWATAVENRRQELYPEEGNITADIEHGLQKPNAHNNME